jgi:hypothetical protein
VEHNTEVLEELRLMRDRVGRLARWDPGVEAAYEQGWAYSGRTPLVVSHFTDVYPRSARGPDELRPAPATWPDTFVMPFHYAHPMTGKR